MDTPTKGEEHCQAPNFLCRRCQFWNDVQRLVSPQTLRDDVTLTLDNLLRNANCLICRVVAAAVTTRCAASKDRRAWPTSHVHVSITGPFFPDTITAQNGHMVVDGGRFRIDLSHSDKAVVRLLIGIYVTFIKDDGSLPSGHVMENQPSNISMTPPFCLRYSTGTQSILTNAEPWETLFFDISLLKAWVQGCDQLHQKHHAQDVVDVGDLPRDFRVIDVSSMKIVNPAPPARFVALSYMWQYGGHGNHCQLEKNNRANLEVHGALQNISLPDIISDSISLCRDMGEHFLWIDQLCIVQDDVESKHRQICDMNKIYQSAAFTIVAALNNRDGRGLPGYRGRPRRSSVWKAARFPNEIPPIFEQELRAPNIINHTLWNKRGWTFQERLLSRRCLFITDFQVIYGCSRGYALEELTYTSQGPFRPSSDYYISYTEEDRKIAELEPDVMPGFRVMEYPQFLGKYTLSSSSSMSDYFRWVMDYTSRQLSFSSDILNAFSGVSNVLEQGLGSRFIFGLPEKHITQSLLWSKLAVGEPQSMLPHIPTWSWASSLGQADYYWATEKRIDKLNDLMDIGTLVRFYFQDPIRGLRKLEVSERWIESEDVTIEWFDGKSDLPDPSDKPGYTRERALWLECPHSPWQTLAHRALDHEACRVAIGFPGALVFNTTVASLELGRDVWDASELPDTLERDVGIYSKRGQCIGYVNKMSPEWINAHASNGMEYDFITICCSESENTSTADPGGSPKETMSWWLHVLLVERVPLSGPYVARRIDVGIIQAHMWKDCNPHWETIILC